MKKYSNFKHVVNRVKSRQSAFAKIKYFALLAIVTLLSMLVLTCEKGKAVAFPSSLTGTWVTDELRYKDRYIDIDELAITLGTGKNTTNTFLIDKIRKSIKKPMDEWIFLCHDREGVPFEFVIFYNSEFNKNLLKLRNMEKIKWRKLNIK